jgi:hypothetical protein
MAEVGILDRLSQSRLRPKAIGKAGVIDLVSVVYSKGHSPLWLARGGGEGQIAEKRDVVAAERPREEGTVNNNLLWYHRLRS